MSLYLGAKNFPIHNGTEKDENDDSGNENDSNVDDEYDDFVVMCPSCCQIFSNESERLQHDFDNCKEPVRKSLKLSATQDSAKSSDEVMHESKIKKETNHTEFTDDVLSLQSEYGMMNNVNDDEYNGDAVYKNNKSKSNGFNSEDIDYLPSYIKNHVSSSFSVNRRMKEEFQDNYFHFKKNELQKKGKNAIVKVKDESTTSIITSGSSIKTKSATYPCDLCGREFVNLQGLSHHKVTHSGSKPYSCSCGRSYTTSGNLKAHQRTHSGIKPYSCEHCSKKFTTKQGWIYHKTLHTGHKPFKCDECGKAYSYDVALNAHKKMHDRLRDNL
ncbi:hypothetical protein SNE40_016603 [Patella caerulea]|uniref:C2H2-type domain-containing protein n=1 Tax=Patella caerulea TaxID=87958 RepID=A0AAN8JEH4_PATCE